MTILSLVSNSFLLFHFLLSSFSERESVVCSVEPKEDNRLNDSFFGCFFLLVKRVGWCNWKKKCIEQKAVNELSTTALDTSQEEKKIEMRRKKFSDDLFYAIIETAQINFSHQGERENSVNVQWFVDYNLYATAKINQSRIRYKQHENKEPEIGCDDLLQHFFALIQNR